MLTMTLNHGCNTSGRNGFDITTIREGKLDDVKMVIHSLNVFGHGVIDV